MSRDSGHDVVERAPDHAAMSAGRNVMGLYLRGIHNDVATIAHPERLGGGPVDGAGRWPRLGLADTGG